MKLVSVKFFQEGKWAVTLEKQINVYEGEIVSGLPVTFGHIVQDAEKGEIVDDDVVESIDSEIDEAKLYSYSELFKMKANEVKDIAKDLGLEDGKKEDLIVNILSNQAYTQEFLDVQEDGDLDEIAMALDLEDVDMSDAVAVTEAILSAHDDDDDDENES